MCDCCQSTVITTCIVYFYIYIAVFVAIIAALIAYTYYRGSLPRRRAEST